jgi:hypothetical protein
MSLVDQVAKAHADHDPHGFKAQGANSAKHSFPATSYTHQEYPKLLYKGDGTLSVHSADALKKALADGWSESVASEPEPVAAEPESKPAE